jgi:hypothetical protein
LGEGADSGPYAVVENHIKITIRAAHTKFMRKNT